MNDPSPETPYDALLVVSFGGPESPADVMPFLENVTRGKNVPHERLLEVAEHYYHFGGVSPINQHNRDLIAALTQELSWHGPALPIYWGNRNWHPLLADTIREMRDAGVQRALAFVTSAYSSYSGCRQYREDIERARTLVGPDAPRIDKIRAFFNHPGYIEAVTQRVREALSGIPVERHATTQFVFTAHSIPLAMANGCRYAEQLAEACSLVTQAIGPFPWKLVYQSRSGPAAQPWLEPDVGDWVKELAAQKACTDIMVVPIGFVSDHMEILFDLDHEAHDIAIEHGLHMVRALTVGTHPRFVHMIRELINERMQGHAAQAVGTLPATPHFCPENCCLSGRPAHGPAAARA